MKILVAVASKHGATKEIADEIGTAVERALAEAGTGPEVHVLFADGVTLVADYDAVILGSAVYMGHWLGSAKKLAVTQQDALRARPVWLFSSGPVGERAAPGVDPPEAAELLTELNARGHHLFGGKIDRHVLRFAERVVVAALRVKDADCRDWPVIRGWAKDIAGELTQIRREASA
ncbi:flavodoxin domain-containing protein [Amycolatopsis sp. NPDC059657]|uniref:flavodoxin domain-containing protein n=1 Tax=Amycolatopsis sp. NPDC059657 TaxID=3346899 RepID=UPI00366D370A